MIPRHSVPFGVGKMLSIMVSHTPDIHFSDIEKTSADALGVRSVILLPSVRAGIHMVVQAAAGPGALVVGPAYTCHTVHKAMALSKARSVLVDSAPGSFLMSSEGIKAAAGPGCALVLSEVYGIPYDLKILPGVYKAGPCVRILDMAMNIPSPERMKQLETRDVALFSFGWGKPMYAGWGGLACFQDPELEGKVRETRDRWIAPESFGLRFLRGCSALLQVAKNQRPLYGLSHQRHLYRLFKNMTENPSPPLEEGHIFSPKPAHALPPEWTRPMTGLHRKLALYNLRHSVQNAELRRSQAEVYLRSLAASGIVRGTGSENLPQSHFPLRIPSALRNAMCDYLRGRGIDTSTLFPLPAGLGRDRYPHAAAAADEVLTLPLGPNITLEEVRMISQCVKDGLQALGC